MRKQILFILIIGFTLSCSDKQSLKKNEITEKLVVLDGFGKAKLGMTISEFENVFHKKIVLKPSGHYNNCFSSEVDSLQINPDIILSKAYLEFNNQKLFYIGTNKNKDLFAFLKRNYGISDREEHGNGFSGSFKTNSKKIFCGYEYVNGSSNIGVGIFPEYIEK